ncbi:MAG TPA: RNA polymerase factor sigma-54 [Spirochaetota bacterium]|nr:RNA polymerase factor sigma-54 [Spirochaetota bacterium]HRZ27052.1 RNA polymerase factor sigma-54 [Spirochaetota bacterium]HSA14703.1 RNA polymerase factor sigma-54 [Spirochaetota bacterium]
MAVSLQLGLKQNQRLVLTQSLKQAIELLQLSTLELSERINEELLNNPVLEESDDFSAQLVPGEVDDLNRISENLSGDESALNREDDQLSKYGDISESVYAPTAEEDRKRAYLESIVAQAESLPDHLLWQAHLVAQDDKEMAVFESVITSLNENGFLSDDRSAIATGLSVPPELVDSVVSKIQLFDPVGCASADTRESLVIQARYFYPDELIVQKILAEHFTELENLNYEKIARGVNRSVAEVIEKSRLIQGLDPFPGRQYSVSEARYITPDIDVKYVEGEIIVTMNDDWIPSLRINPYYLEILRKKSLEKKLKEYIQDKLHSARYLLRNISSRRETIVKVVAAIMEAQKDFLSKGPGNLKPLTHVEIAEKIGMHESTVSRATSNKFVQTSWGVFELKYFFVSKLKSTNAIEQSSDQVMNLIKNLIDNEDQQSPMSDEDIVLVLRKNGINVARRTISKYRSVLDIPPSNKRKKINMIKSEGTL